MAGRGSMRAVRFPGLLRRHWPQVQSGDASNGLQVLGCPNRDARLESLNAVSDEASALLERKTSAS